MVTTSPSFPTISLANAAPYPDPVPRIERIEIRRV